MKVILIGLGAQTKYALDIFQQVSDCEVIGAVDVHDDAKRRADAENWSSVPIMDEDEVKNVDAEAYLACLSDPALKSQTMVRAEDMGLIPVSAIHPQSAISPKAKIEPGAIVNAFAVVQPFANIGRGAMIHAHAVIEHDCRLGDCCNIAMGAVLAGGVVVGDNVRVYANATVKQGASIGADAVVGAGAVVLEDVAMGTTVVGNPALVMASNGPQS